MEENVLYQDDRGIIITSARAVFGETMYAMSNVASVSLKIEPASTGVGGLLILIGVCIGASPLFLKGISETGITGVIVLVLLGLAMAASGVLAAYQAKATYYVVVQSTSGKSNALVSTNKEYAQIVLKAFTDAIISRG